jgi:hypothetical protein
VPPPLGHAGRGEPCEPRSRVLFRHKSGAVRDICSAPRLCSPDGKKRLAGVG